MLTTMRANVMAARAICYATGVAADLAESGQTAEERESARLREELLTPIAKAWSTDMGVEVASLGVQVHGGMGFMNETLAAQLYRDARIAPIYEGTNGIQAIDLVGRKLSMADGAAMRGGVTVSAGSAASGALVRSRSSCAVLPKPPPQPQGLPMLMLTKEPPYGLPQKR